MGKLIKKFGTFSMGPIIGALLAFLTVPVITYFISPEEYGRSSMFTLAQSTISMVVYLGMDQAFVREFHEAKGQTARLLANALLVPIAIVVVLDAVILCNVSGISILLFDTPQEHLAVYALALMLPFMILENFGLLRLRMEEKGLKYSVFYILLKFMTLLFTVLLFILWEKSFQSVVYAIALAEIVNGTLLAGFALRDVRLFGMRPDKELILRMLKFGLPLLPASIIFWALTSMDKVMLRTMCDYTELGLYSAAFKIAQILSLFQSCFTVFWTPVSYRWYESGVEKKYFENVIKLVSFGMTGVCLGVLLCKELLILLLGAEFGQAIHIFPFIMLYPIMYTMSETTAMGIGFTRKTGYNIFISGLAGCVNIGLNYWLIPIWGGVGAAVATGISYMVFFWARTLIARRLWWSFSVRKHVLYSLLITVNCTVHTFVDGWLAYAVTLASVAVLLVMNVSDIKDWLARLKAMKNPPAEA